MQRKSESKNTLGAQGTVTKKPEGEGRKVGDKARGWGWTKYSNDLILWREHMPFRAFKEQERPLNLIGEVPGPASQSEKSQGGLGTQRDISLGSGRPGLMTTG